MQVSNWLVCMHTSPGNPPNIGAALGELRQSLFRPKAKSLGFFLALALLLKSFMYIYILYLQRSMSHFVSINNPAPPYTFSNI